jgi:hypothetical protein
MSYDLTLMCKGPEIPGIHVRYQKGPDAMHRFPQAVSDRFTHGFYEVAVSMNRHAVLVGAAGLQIDRVSA